MKQGKACSEMRGVLLVPPSSPTLWPIDDGLDVNVRSNITWFHLNHDMVSRRIYKPSFYGGHSTKILGLEKNRNIEIEIVLNHAIRHTQAGCCLGSCLWFRKFACLILNFACLLFFLILAYNPFQFASPFCASFSDSFAIIVIFFLLSSFFLLLYFLHFSSLLPGLLFRA